MQSNAANALESARRSSGSAAPGDPVRHRHGIRHQRPEVENAADDPVEKESHCGMATKIRTRKCLNFLLTRFSSRYPRLLYYPALASNPISDLSLQGRQSMLNSGRIIDLKSIGFCIDAWK